MIRGASRSRTAITTPPRPHAELPRHTPYGWVDEVASFAMERVPADSALAAWNAWAGYDPDPVLPEAPRLGEGARQKAIKDLAAGLEVPMELLDPAAYVPPPGASGTLRMTRPRQMGKVNEAIAAHRAHVEQDLEKNQEAEPDASKPTWTGRGMEYGA